MKSILIIENNLSQIVLTPENEHEKQVLNLINEQKVETVIKVGNFNQCQGGWVRYYPSYRAFDESAEDIESLMLVLKNNK